MLSDEMMDKWQINCTTGDSSKCNAITDRYEVTKESTSNPATKEREKNSLTKNKPKSFFTFSGQELIWPNAISMALLHLAALYCYITFPYFQRFGTFLFTWFYGLLGALGTTAGVHRLWSHRAYKAKTPLRILLLCLFCIAGQNSVYNWVRDHRVHHKYSETDADPHNSRRGLFFSHCGWLMLRKHPEVIKKGRQIDMSDILADPVVAFGEKYFNLLKIFFCFVLPVIIPMYLWNEHWYYAIVSQWFMRHPYLLNVTWTINSLAHAFGSRPYNKSIAPTDNAITAFITNAEGWHNYHHTFPWDYRAAELGRGLLNLTTHFIHLFAAIGWAYDFKQPSEDLIRRTIYSQGDGSHGEVPMPEEMNSTS